MNLTRKINYFVKRRMIKAKQLLAENTRKNALKIMSSDEIMVFNSVVDIATKHRKLIRFDPHSLEILIVLPDMLITLKSGSVSIQNTYGFLTKNIPNESFKYLTELVEFEAHKERRRLKFEVKKRIMDFLSNIEH